MVEAFWRSLEMLRTIMAGVIMLLFVYMIGAVFAQVIGRYVFNFSIAAADETSTFALIWMVLLAAGLAMRRGQHVGIDILAAQCTPRVRRILTLVSALLALWFLWILFVGGLALVEVGQFQTSAAMNWPMSFIYVAVPIGTGYLALEFIIAVAPHIFGQETESAGTKDLSDDL